MKTVKIPSLVLTFFLFIPAIANAQVDALLKVQGTGFYGNFGETYAAVGYETGFTFQPSGKVWAAGISYSKNWLGHDGTGSYGSKLEGKMNLLNFQYGAKGTVAKYIHPFAYAVVGFRFMSYTNSAISTGNDPLFTSFSLGYGAKTGLQIGGNKWRFEGSIAYQTGTNSRYLTPESFEKAADAGKSYRDYTLRSPISGLSVGVGVAYVLNRGQISIE